MITIVLDVITLRSIDETLLQKDLDIVKKNNVSVSSNESDGEFTLSDDRKPF